MNLILINQNDMFFSINLQKSVAIDGQKEIS